MHQARVRLFTHADGSMYVNPTLLTYAEIRHSHGQDSYAGVYKHTFALSLISQLGVIFWADKLRKKYSNPQTIFREHNGQT